MKSMQRHHSYTTAAKDSPAPEALSAATYWLTTVLEDRAESAPSPPAEETEQ